MYIEGIKTCIRGYQANMYVEGIRLTSSPTLSSIAVPLLSFPTHHTPQISFRTETSPPY